MSYKCLPLSLADIHKFMKQILSQHIWLDRHMFPTPLPCYASCLTLSVEKSTTEVTNITKLNTKHVNIQLMQDALCTHHQILIWAKTENYLPINQILIIFQMHDMYALTNSQTITWYEFNTYCVSVLKLFLKCGQICKTNTMSQGSPKLNKMQKDSK